jgi:succinate dehydrogenase / fumarate reductase, cytochrome b subunit
VNEKVVAAGAPCSPDPGNHDAELRCLREAQPQGAVADHIREACEDSDAYQGPQPAHRGGSQFLPRGVQQVGWYIDRLMVPPIETSPYKRTIYRGGVGMWSWILHRGSGLVVLGFLFLHILDTSLVLLGPGAYDRMAGLYESALFRPLEVLLMFLVIYHAFNGLRVILVDFWSKGVRYDKQLSRLVMAVTVLLFLPSALIMLRP